MRLDVQSLQGISIPRINNHPGFQFSRLWYIKYIPAKPNASKIRKHIQQPSAATVSLLIPCFAVAGLRLTCGLPLADSDPIGGMSGILVPSDIRFVAAA